MRIAVLVYGRLKQSFNTYNNIINAIGSQYNIDFFVSSDNADKVLLNTFINLYKPILYNNEPIKYDYDLSKYPGKRNETNCHNMTCHFINKNRVFLLLEQHIANNNISYDIVISLRLDLHFKSMFNFNEILDNTIYIPSGNDYANGINDQIAYGKVDVMKKYNCMNPVDLLTKKLTIPHAENLNKANIIYNNLNIKRVFINYNIIRFPNFIWLRKH